MGLGKTIQGIAAAELLAQQSGIKKVLVICPTSLKSQWPGFRFFNKHRIVDEKGMVMGYKNMAELRKTLAPIMLRRTRD